MEFVKPFMFVAIKFDPKQGEKAEGFQDHAVERPGVLLTRLQQGGRVSVFKPGDQLPLPEYADEFDLYDLVDRSLLDPGEVQRDHDQDQVVYDKDSGKEDSADENKPNEDNLQK